MEAKIRTDIVYKHIISLGFFCSVASEIKRIGLRDCSSPFDWLISEWGGVEESIRTNFNNFLEYEDLEQNRSNRSIYRNSIGMEFFHDFSGKIPLKRQIKKVKRKYNRRIERFKKNILEPTVFIRYIKNQQELDYWIDNKEKVLKLLKSYNSNNEIILVANDELKQEQKDIIVYWTEKDEGDSVARYFFDKNAELLSLIQNLQYEKSNKTVHKKQLHKLYKRIINRYYAYKPEYIHCKEYE